LNYTYVTLLSSVDYLPGILALNDNLKNIGCKYPLHIMVTNNVIVHISKYLIKEKIPFTIVPKITYSPETIAAMNNARLETIASKINVFRLEELEKVVYLDTDSYFIKPIDELFNYPDGALYDCGEPRGFCGLFTCIPRMHPLDYYISLLKHNHMWESDLIEELWFPFKSNPDYRIPYSYFVNTKVQDFNTLLPIEEKVHGFHFCGELKPWKFKNPYDYITAFHKEWPFPNENRNKIIKDYYYQYIQPIKDKYPEIFTY